MITDPVMHAFKVPVHVPLSKEKREAFDGCTGKGITPVSVQTVIARDVDHARDLAEDVIHKFLNDPTIHTFTFRSEVICIAKDVLAC